jgi:hypothetical protein
VTHVRGYHLPLPVVPVVLAYAAAAAWWVWRGRAHRVGSLGVGLRWAAGRNAGRVAP